jgi:restriction system protein
MRQSSVIFRLPPVSRSQLESVNSKAKVESDPTLLTLGENIRLIERDEIWNKLGLSIHKVEFLKRLIETRDVRNDVMHFGTDPPGAEQKKSLDQMEHFLRHVFV